jgi:DNA-binding NarL/FixJ family response regulator
MHAVKNAKEQLRAARYIIDPVMQTAIWPRSPFKPLPFRRCKIAVMGRGTKPYRGRSRLQSFACAEEFLESGEQHEKACLIADVRMPGMSGLDLQHKLKAENCPILTIFITAHDGEAMGVRAMTAGAVESLPTPLSDEVLLECVPTALES